jgi:eukaryotic-like serine/threonine-protein kinase
MIWKPGTLIQGAKYQITEILGVGGFGVTYRALDRLSDKTVAIKTANDLIQSKPDCSKHQEQFIQEAFRLAKCHHPHIVRVDDICLEDGLWCMVMEYITGKDLEQYVIERGSLSEAEAISHTRQIGEALHYIHQQGLLHRDVKPANIMLRHDRSEAILIDFGLAREFIAGKTMTHSNSRSECFAPIEQYRLRDKRDAYTDVYALAATLYYQLTGVQPLPAQFRWQGANLIPPIKHNPQISDRINRAIIQGMALEPHNRPQSIPQWLELLEFDPSIVGHSENYQRLQELLAVGEWRKADEETYEIILKTTNRVKEGWLDYESTVRLSCDVLQQLDKIWLEFSQGHFGFSIQRQIWQELGGKIDYYTECQLGELLQWRVREQWQNYDRLNFSLTAPMGHLPWDGHLPKEQLRELGLTGTYGRWSCCLILSRCSECGI